MFVCLLAMATQEPVSWVLFTMKGATLPIESRAHKFAVSFLANLASS